MRTASENRDILPSRNPSSELPRIRYMRSSQNASHEKFAGVTLHAISKENFIRYPAVDGYVLYKIQTAQNCVSALGSPRGARHD